MGSIIRVFLASPGDVKKERDEVKDIIQEVNNLTGAHFNMVFQVINWENMGPDMGRPQGIVNRNARISSTELFLGILGTRFGSNPGPNEYNAESGTQEEFEQAYESWNRKGKPRIKIFRSNRKINNRVDITQLEKVQKFFQDFSPEGKHPGLVKEYSTIKEFRTAVYNVLFEFALNYNKKIEKGLITFPIAEDIPERRWTEKAKAIRESSTFIKLMAHSGYSFLTEEGSRYRPQLLESLEKGRRVHIIINTPWSYGGLLCAISNDVNSWAGLLGNICKGDAIGSSVDSIMAAIKQSYWYRVKIRNTIDGYNSLRSKYADLIQLRFYKYEIPASVLITEQCAFIEPYIMTNRDARNIQGLNTFEIQVWNSNDAWKNYNNYFELIWNLSIPYTNHYEEISSEKLRLFFRYEEGT